MILAHTDYLAYSYAYPHKSSYRFFDPPLSLESVWAEEDKSALFLYFHIPFCEMRCGFCNLFTLVNPDQDLPAAYLQTLAQEAEKSQAALGQVQVARMAIGGGTPTFLSAAQLASLFDLAEKYFGLGPVPISVETSPQTSQADKLALLRERGVTRLSMGVQSFLEGEARAMGRPQNTSEVHQALERLKAAGFPTLNLDLIYGGSGQNVHSWLETLRQALDYAPEELYLYPLYVRPLTGLARTKQGPEEDYRPELYRAGRDFLRNRGYEQVSMRMFRRADGGQNEPAAPLYCCQKDGMLGLGCGARSYTRGLHYSSDYAVSRGGVLSILQNYLQRAPASFGQALYGIRLNPEEQRRRYLIKSLLHHPGLDLEAYQAYFGTSVWEDFPQLAALFEHGLAVESRSYLRLNDLGLERSDVIGYWLYSPAILASSEAFELR
jgi:oxygen-independent coproporphyrinogen-3 oxidase